MKRIIVFFIILTCYTVAFAYDVKVKFIYYNLNKEDKTAAVTFKKGNYYRDYIKIPSEIIVNKEKYTVNCICDSAFFECRNITYLELPPTITSIGKSAFEGCVKIIEQGDEQYYDNLCYTIPKSLESIGDRAFAYSSVFNQLKLPSKLTTIGSEAFIGSTITTIYIPEGLKHIGYAAFEGCESLMAVSIISLESWCEIDFETIYSNPLSCAHSLFLNSNPVTDIIIPYNITDIKPNTFVGSKLQSVRIPVTVKSIGSYAFYKCPDLKTVRINNPDIIIDEYNFEDFEGKFLINDGKNNDNLCQPPVISYVDGKLIIESPTPGSICQYIIQPEDVDSSGIKGELFIYAIAMADGYENSDLVKVNLLELMKNK